MRSHVDAQLRSAGLSPGAAASKAAVFARLLQLWAERNPAPPAGAWFVPGRIELLGKHTDYAGGRSLLCAVERGICLLAGPRPDGRVRLFDAGWPTQAEFAWNVAAVPPPASPWAIYPATVARRLARDFPHAFARSAPGADLVFASDLPRAAGLSSSSALIVASYLGLTAAAGGAPNQGGRPALAEYLAAVESGRPWGRSGGGAGVGTHGGSEDHTAILCCKAGHWSEFRFCPVRSEAVLAAPAAMQLLVGVSGVTAAKTGGARAAYNRAARMVAAILAAWNAFASRCDPTLGAALASRPGAVEDVRAALRQQGGGEFSSEALHVRFEQFVEESETLVPAAAAAAAAGDWVGFGACAARSQALAERGLENQTAETRALVAIALALGAAAASAFGAGFGGAVWALVQRRRQAEFRRAWSAEYRRQFASHASASLFFQSAAGPAAFALALDGSATAPLFPEPPHGIHQLEPA